MKPYLIALTIIGFTACTRQTLVDNIVFPAVDTKAAVFCLLTPDDSVFVVVKAVRSINNDSKQGTQSISDARVTLLDSNTGQQIAVPYTGSNGMYGCPQRNLPIVPGHTYRLNVRVSNLTAMQSTCQMPAKAAVIDTIAYGEPYSDSFFNRRRVAFNWHDVSSSIETYNYFISGQYDNQGRTITYTYFDNTLITQVNNLLYYNDDTIDSGTPHTYHLFTTSQPVYTFFTIAQQMRDGSNGSATDFFGGYQGIPPTFTNIENGYGIFGGYLKTSKTISFP